MQGLMAVVACDLFSHPAPEIPNRIEVGTIGRQRDESESEFAGDCLYGLRPMPGGAVPKDHAAARPPSIIQPARDSAVPFEAPKSTSREAWPLCAIRTVASNYELKRPKIEQKNAFERTLRTFSMKKFIKFTVFLDILRVRSEANSV